MKVKSLLFSFITVLVSVQSYAQNPEWINYFENWDFPQCFTQDTSNLWIGTNNGLVQLDKGDLSNKVVFNTSNSSLPSNNIQSIVIDNNGVLWIGTGNGLTKYDGTSWTIFNDTNSLIPYNSVDLLVLAPNNELWIANSSRIPNSCGLVGKLVKFDQISNWSEYSINRHVITEMKLDKNDNLWMLTNTFNSQAFNAPINHKLRKFDGSAITVFNFDSSGIYRNLNFDNNNNVWLTGSNSLVKFDGINWIFDSNIPNGLISSLFVDNSNNKWMGIPGYGLVYYDGNNTTIYDTLNISGYYSNISHISNYENGSLLLSCTYYGYSRFMIMDTTSHQFALYNIPTSESWLPYDNVSALALEGDTVWIAVGTGKSYLMSYDGTSWVVYGDFPFSKNIRDIVIDNQKRKWIATDAGLQMFDGLNWVYYNVNNSGIQDNDVYSLAVENNNTIWVGTASGLSKFDGTNWQNITLPATNIISNYIFDIALDLNGDVWAANGNRVIKYDGTTVQTFNTVYPAFTGVSVLNIEIDKNGIKWISTGKGLIRYDGINWKVCSSYYSGTITIDKGGYIWVGNYGVNKFDNTGQFVYQYTTINSGLSNNRVNAIVIDKEGKKWIGTNKGLNIYNKEGVVSVLEYPRIHKFNIKIYPNPFSSSTTIEFDNKKNEKYSLLIYKTTGQLVRKIDNITNGKIKIERENLNSGLYFVSIMNNTLGVATGKILIE